MRTCFPILIAGFVGILGQAATFEVDWSRVSAGGTMGQSAGPFEVSSTIGQHEAGPGTGDQLSVQRGFWVATLPGDPPSGTGTTADLLISIQDAADPVVPLLLGGRAQIRYTVTVLNQGPAVATGILLTNRLPTGTTLVSASSTRPVSAETGVVVWRIGMLGATASVELSLSLSATGPGLYVNEADVSANEPDPTSMNTAAQTTVVASRPPLVFTWTGAVSAAWSDPANWFPANGPPAPGDTANITQGTASLGEDTTISTLNLSGGGFSGSGALNVVNHMIWTGGTVGGSGTTTIAAGGVLEISGERDKNLSGRTILNLGTATWTGSGRILGGDGPTFHNGAGALFDLRNDAIFQWTGGGGGPTFINAGTLLKSAGEGVSVFQGLIFNNTGTVDIRKNTFSIVGNYAPATSSLHRFALVGYKPGSGFARLQVSGTLTMAGRLELLVTDDFAPTNGASFRIISAAPGREIFASVRGQTFAGNKRFDLGYDPSGLVLTVNQSTLPDRDGDGLPDDYELAHGLDPNLSEDAGKDNDRDGHSNLQEFLAGTDPTKPDSVLKLKISLRSEQTLSFSFPAALDRTYRLERSVELGNPIWTLVEQVQGDGKPALIFDRISERAPAAYYRVVAP